MCYLYKLVPVAKPVRSPVVCGQSKSITKCDWNQNPIIQNGLTIEIQSKSNHKTIQLFVEKYIIGAANKRRPQLGGGRGYKDVWQNVTLHRAGEGISRPGGRLHEGTKFSKKKLFFSIFDHFLTIFSTYLKCHVFYNSWGWMR